MMIDDIYKSTQAELNKDQLGYLKPMYYNSFIRQAMRKVRNRLFLELKTNVRKKNWHLDGKDFAHYSEHLQQLLEYYSYDTPLSTPYIFPNDLEYVEDVFHSGVRVEKVHYSDYQDLQNNKYAKPSKCAPVCSKVGDKLKVSPSSIEEVDLHYIRQAKIPKWTFEEDMHGRPMFDETKLDFQDVDMPDTFYDDLISIVVEKASIMLRDQLPIQAENTDQQQETVAENRQ